MVQRQLAYRDIVDPLVLAAMSIVPRHLFVPEDMRDQAYEDGPLPIGQGQTISQPYMVAFMVQSLALRGGESVLEIGTGSGYGAAVLGQIAGHVISIERVTDLASDARARLASLGYANIEVLQGDGSVGLAERSPFDAIVVTAAAPAVPPPLLQQIKPGGRIVLPVGTAYGQTLELVTRCGPSEWRHESLAPVMFVPLRGVFGWSDR
jgi:protein-L-isoaspartate(D-aspartate) O-methyltransferase